MTIAETIFKRHYTEPKNVASHMAMADAIHEEACCASVQRIDLSAEEITDAWGLTEPADYEIEQHYFIDDSPMAFVRNARTGKITSHITSVDFADLYYTAQAKRDQEEGVFH